MQAGVTGSRARHWLVPGRNVLIGLQGEFRVEGAKQGVHSLTFRSSSAAEPDGRLEQVAHDLTHPEVFAEEVSLVSALRKRLWAPHSSVPNKSETRG